MSLLRFPVSSRALESLEPYQFHAFDIGGLGLSGIYRSIFDAIIIMNDLICKPTSINIDPIHSPHINNVPTEASWSETRTETESRR